MVNKVTLIGWLGQDPEVRRLESGVAVAKLRLATSERYRDKEGEWQSQTEWHDVIGWRWLAERAEQYFKKGNLIYVEGKLTTRKWQDKDGNDRYTTEVVANNFRSLEKREGGSHYSSSFPGAEDAPPTVQNSVETKTAETTSPTVEPVADASEDDDLPF